MNGAKNKINFTLDWYKRSDLYNSEGTWSGNVYTVANVGTVTINSDSTLTFKKTSSNTRLIFRIVPMSEGLNYIGNWMFGCPEGGGDNTYRMVCEQASSPYGNRGIDGGSGSVIGDSTIPIYIYIVLDPSYTTPTEGVIFKPMIISAEAKNAGFKDYMPYSLPNTAITPELIELCDSGAKNLFNSAASLTYTNMSQNNGTFTATQTDSRTQFHMRMVAYNGSTAGAALFNDFLSANGTYSYEFTKTSAFNSLKFGHSGASVDLYIQFDASNLVNGTTYVFQFKLTQYNPANNLAYTDLMICTKAAFAVSPKFVPYAKSNYSLTQYTDGLKLSDTLKTSGSLDDIRYTSFLKATSDVTGKPEGITSSCIVRTSFPTDDRTGGLQEIWIPGSSSSAYYRVCWGSQWNSWVRLN